MATITSLPSSPKFDNGDEFLHSLGDVPMSRVVFNPWPGTATEADLVAFVERDKRLCELIDGTLVEKPKGHFESFLAGWLITYLNVFLETTPIGVVMGEAGLMRLKSGRIRMPDVSYFSFESLNGLGLEEARISPVSPDLAVEIVSESNSEAELRQKTREYFQSGSRLVWIVYPATRTVDVFEQPTDQPTHTLTQNDTINGGAVIPGFTLELAKLFSKRLK